MTNHLDPQALEAAATELFFTITAHKSAADVVGFNWQGLPAATRAPWETASQKVVSAYMGHIGATEQIKNLLRAIDRLTDENAALKAAQPVVPKLTDAEWREFQAIPDQGYSHRAWVDARITERVAAAQPRTVETVEQLDALPVQSIVLDSDDDDPLQLVDDGEGGSCWVRFGDTGCYSPADIILPATVLWVPTEGGGDAT